MIKTIWEAKKRLIGVGVNPPYSIILSPQAHEQLAIEISIERGNRRSMRIFEALGVKVDIDEKCPMGGGYLIGGDQDSKNII